MSDYEYVLHALRNGTWERYEHPDRGETLTLKLGNFAVLSLHNILVERDYPVDQFWNDLKKPETVALLMAKMARLNYELEVAIDAVVKSATEDL